MREFHFLVEHDDFSAELLVGGEISLYSLALLINKAVRFEFGFDDSFEFCDNLKQPFRSKERYSLLADMDEVDDGSIGVQETSIADVFRPRRKMIYHCEFGTDWYFLVTCTAIRESTAKRSFKKILSTSDTPPEQYPEDFG